MRKYKRPEQDPYDLYRADPLPVERQAAIYYRQSTDAQIGHISTTLQTVDLFEHLVHLGLDTGCHPHDRYGCRCKWFQENQ